MVFVTYCTCDVHWGDNQRNYGGGDVARHRGRVNAAVAEKFAREHFIDPDRVFVTGSSAGSYGAIMNSYWLMKEVWPNADYSVLGDAGVGVITKAWLDEYIDNWGVAANFPDDLPGVVGTVQDLSLVDLIDGLSQKFPTARFANYDSSYDGGSGSQAQFFQVMRYPTPPSSNILSNWGNYQEATCQWNACMREYKAENAVRSSQYHFYTGAGSRHTVFGSDKVYTETKSTNAAGTGVTVSDWIQAMIDDTPAWEDVDCNNLNGDCNLSNTCQGGANKGLPCTGAPDCPGGSCQTDPDSATPPYANNDTVTCAPTVCPCGPAAAVCVGGTNAGNACTGDIPDCKATPGAVGSCVYVNCPTFTP